MSYNVHGVRDCPGCAARDEEIARLRVKPLDVAPVCPVCGQYDGPDCPNCTVPSIAALTAERDALTQRDADQAARLCDLWPELESAEYADLSATEAIVKLVQSREAERDRYREALRPFAQDGAAIDPREKGNKILYLWDGGEATATIADARRARAALGKREEK